MSSSEGNSTTRPLRKRKSKRFDRSGGSPRATASAVIDGTGTAAGRPDDDTGETGTVNGVVANSSVADDHIVESSRHTEPVTKPHVETGAAPATPATSATPVLSASPAGGDSAQNRVADPAIRNRTLDELTLCGRCGHEVSTINIEVDGNVLVMESCDNCDTRRWELAGESIELQQALDHVGEHAGRRR